MEESEKRLEKPWEEWDEQLWMEIRIENYSVQIIFTMIYILDELCFVYTNNKQF